MTTSPSADFTLALPNDDLSLDLGSGPDPAPGFVGVDLITRPRGADGAGGVLYADLFSGEPWPFESGSCRRLRAWHVIEHIPRHSVVIGETAVRRTIRTPGAPRRVVVDTLPIKTDAFFWFFSEAFRVAAPGCRFELAWPHPQSDGADQDPTHHRRIPVSMLHYLSTDGRRALHVTHYPVDCNWLVQAESVFELGSAEQLARFTGDDGVVDIARAKQCHNVFDEIRAVLVKPLE